MKKQSGSSLPSHKTALFLLILSWSLALLALAGILHGLGLDERMPYLLASLSLLFSLIAMFIRKHPYRLALLACLVFSAGLMLFFATGINIITELRPQGK